MGADSSNHPTRNRLPRNGRHGRRVGVRSLAAIPATGAGSIAERETRERSSGTSTVADARTPGLVWRWTPAVLGGLYAVPAAVVVLSDPQRGLALAVGALPAALVGLLPTRRRRLLVIVLGAVIGLSMFVGGVLANAPVVAVLAIGLFGVGSALLAGRFALGRIVMTLALPMVGVGLSYSDIAKAAGAAGLMVVGSVGACLISMLWPEQAAPAGRQRPGQGAPPTFGYGVRLGAAGATAAAIGFIFDFDHVGWACAAALLVMRPTADMQRLRSVGRIIAVFAGAVAGVGLVRVSPPAAVYSIAAILAMAGAGGTRQSRWYVTPAFSTFFVFLLLLYSDPQTATARFDQRVLETLLGVGLAYLFGLALPALSDRLAPEGVGIRR